MISLFFCILLFATLKMEVHAQNFVTQNQTCIQINATPTDARSELVIDTANPNLFLLVEEEKELAYGNVLLKDEIISPNLFGLLASGSTTTSVHIAKFKIFDSWSPHGEGYLQILYPNDIFKYDKRTFLCAKVPEYYPFCRRMWYDLGSTMAELKEGNNLLQSAGLRLVKITPARSLSLPIKIQAGENAFVSFPKGAITSGTKISIDGLPLASTPHALNVNSFIETSAIAIYPLGITFLRPVKVRLKKLRNPQISPANPDVKLAMKVYPGKFNVNSFEFNYLGNTPTGDDPNWAEFYIYESGIYYCTSFKDRTNE